MNTATKLRFPPHNDLEVLEQLRNCKLVIEFLVTVTLLCNYRQEALHKSLFEIWHVVINVCVASIPGPWRLRLLLKFFRLGATPPAPARNWVLLIKVSHRLLQKQVAFSWGKLFVPTLTTVLKATSTQIYNHGESLGEGCEYESKIDRFSAVWANFLSRGNRLGSGRDLLPYCSCDAAARICQMLQNICWYDCTETSREESMFVGLLL